MAGYVTLDYDFGIYWTKKRTEDGTVKALIEQGLVAGREASLSGEDNERVYDFDNAVIMLRHWLDDGEICWEVEWIKNAAEFEFSKYAVAPGAREVFKTAEKLLCANSDFCEDAEIKCLETGDYKLLSASDGQTFYGEAE